MLEMLMQWYRRRFSDPEAIALLVILVAGFGIIFFFSGLLGMANCAPAIYWLLPPLGDVDCIGGFCRYIATDGVRGTAYRLATGHLLNSRYAGDAQ